MSNAPMPGAGLAGAQPPPPDFSQGTTSANATNAKNIQNAQGGVQQSLNNFGSSGNDSADFANLANAGKSLVGAVRTAASPNYGGYANGANDFAGYTQQLGAADAQRAAPVLDTSQINQARGAVGQGLSAASGGLDALATSAAGGGPGATAAQAAFDTSANSGTLAGLQAAGAGRDAASRAAATGGAVGGTGAALGSAAAGAAAQRAAAAQQGQEAYSHGAEGLTKLATAEQGQDFGTAMDQASIQERQNALNQQANLGLLGLGQSAQTAQLDAQAQEYAANVGQYTAAQGLAAQQQSALVGAGLGATTGAIGDLSKVGGAASGAAASDAASAAASSAASASDFGDVRMREPGGGSGWTLREEPTFLLARNDRTGEMRKLATEPLSHEEAHQALAPHGAGPIGAPGGRTVGDLRVGPAQSQMAPAPKAPAPGGGIAQAAPAGGPMQPQARTKQTSVAAPSSQPMQPQTSTLGPRGASPASAPANTPSGGPSRSATVRPMDGQDPSAPSGTPPGGALTFAPGSVPTQTPPSNGNGPGTATFNGSAIPPPSSLNGAGASSTPGPTGPAPGSPASAYGATGGQTMGVGGNPLANYGGLPGGANATFGYDASQGSAAASQVAPTIDTTNTSQDAAAAQAALGQQGSALALLGQTAQGQGPAIKAAQDQLAQNVTQGANSTNAIAASTSGGGRGLAAAHQGAALTNAEGAGAATTQSRALTANMESQAQQQYEAAAQGFGASAMGMQGQALAQANGQAGLTQEQEALGQQGQLGFLGLGNQAENAQLAAGVSQYGTGVTAQEAAAAQAQQQQNQLISGVAGLGVGLLGAVA